MEQITSVKVISGAGARECLLEVGKAYVIQPLNPRKKKHRNRECEIVGFVTDSSGHTLAKVRFRDNGRIGKVDLSDLVSLE